jgi:hypothetical protein
MSKMSAIQMEIQDWVAVSGLGFEEIARELQVPVSWVLEAYEQIELAQWTEDELRAFDYGYNMAQEAA